ncbi:MAG: Helix-turn-helix domain protein [Pelotomaculum sp. PtaU1.Bin065]|nr:MAG: Helix-turn-helix domain protein [Pelotomaculum sp. PtaU1.Bin065]
MTELPEILTVQEAAKYLRLKRSTAYEYVKQGLIPSVRLGRQIRIPKDQLINMMDGKEMIDSRTK